MSYGKARFSCSRCPGTSLCTPTRRAGNKRNDSTLFSHRFGLAPGSLRRNNSRLLSMAHEETSKSLVLESFKQRRVPIFVMMPVDALGIDTSGVPQIRKVKALTMSLKALKLAGVHGITVEVWWGIVERCSPFDYNWSVYEQLFKLISGSGLKLHVSLCFHSNEQSFNGKGGVSLPLWILEFLNKFETLMGSVIEEVSVGLGPSGELRYPAHPPNDGRWKFPGIGEFQCYDKYMMEDLQRAACLEGQPEWGDKGPQNAGYYNSLPSGVPFFEDGGESFSSDYGQFFLEWYSGRLIHHADAILEKAANVFNKYQNNGSDTVLLVAKIGGIYWWYQTESHPAELSAGYYNTALRDGYDPLASVLSRHGAALHVSCLEMMDSETPSHYRCSPEGLLQQIRKVSKERIIHLTGRNTNERFDKNHLQAGLWQIMANCYQAQAGSFTYFRMNDKIFRVENWNNFLPFVRRMHTDL
ncbi:hypothetical protein IFM89_024235 [Coptis chinensis]|uniref:Beta-amylase n=1 Tax=Coptis chinensis TaxID=261450 RepID=A0A835H0T3_9MAGN|nr:hypothetical protein IFM89_024235 [Coptis chinensis]